MKKLYLLLLICISTLVVNAQMVEPLSSFDSGKQELLLLNQGAKVSYDTLGWSQFLTLATGITRFRLTGGGFIFGTNIGVQGRPNNQFAQGFIDFTGGGYGLIGTFLRVSDIHILSTNGCNIYVRAHKIDATQTYTSGSVSHTINIPGTILGESMFHISSVDTTSAGNLGYVTTMFPNPISMWDGSDFALVFDASECSTSGDTIGVFASSDGLQDQVFGIENTWWRYPAANPFWVRYNHVFTNTRMPMLFAIADRSFANVNDLGFFQGLQLTLSPNPVSDILNIQFAVSNGMNTSVEIFDINGRIVHNEKLGFKGEGSHLITRDISHLSSGSYLVSIIGERGRITKKLIVE